MLSTQHMLPIVFLNKTKMLEYENSNRCHLEREQIHVNIDYHIFETSKLRQIDSP